MTAQEPLAVRLPSHEELFGQINELREEVRGQIEERQRQIRRHRHQILFLAIGGLLSLGLLAWRGERADDAILDSRFEACQARAAAVVDFNGRREAIGQAIIDVLPGLTVQQVANLRDSLVNSRQEPEHCVR